MPLVEVGVILRRNGFGINIIEQTLLTGNKAHPTAFRIALLWTTRSKMKIVVLNGSPRKKGSTAELLKAMAEILKEKPNVDVQYVDIADYQLKYCTGCMSCYRRGVCYLDDDTERLNKLIAEADGLIVGSPTYASNISGMLKTFIDRGHFVLEQSLKDKYTFSLSTCEIAGGGSVTGVLQTLFRYSGGILAGKYVCKLPFNTSPFDDAKVKAKLTAKTEKYYRKINSGKPKSLIDTIVHYIALHIIIKPQVLKRAVQYKAVIERWREIGVI